jgi:tetratricopeptide (TPR) repeat protein
VLPFDSRDLRSRAYREIQRIIREVDPPTPSGRLSTIATGDAERAAIIARARQERVDQLASTLRRELEWIPMKAMRKDREERYMSPNDLAQDVRNYLAGMPLVAAPESAAYRVRKFVRRNRVAVATSAAFVALLAAATVVSTLFGIAESRARSLAERRERDVRKVLEFQHRQLAEVGQEEAGLAMFGEISRQFANRLELEGVPPERREAAVREFRDAIRGVNPTDVAFQLIERVILRRGVAEAGTEHANDPFLQAGLLETIGRTYLELGKEEQARELFARAADAFAREFGPDDRRTLTALDFRLRASADPAASIPEAERVLADRRRLFGDVDPDTMSSMRTLARLLADAGRGEDAVAMRERLVRAGSLPGADPLLAVVDLTELGNLCRELGRPDDAVAACRRAKAAMEALPAPVPKRLQAHVLGDLGLALVATLNQALMVEGLAELRKVPPIDDEVDGVRHARAFHSRNNLAVRLGTLARPESGLPEEVRIRIAEEERRLLEEIRVNGQGIDMLPDGYYLGIVADAVHQQRNPSGADRRQEQLAAALSRATDALRVLRARHGDQDEVVLKVGGSVAALQLGARDFAGAEATYRSLIAARTRTLRTGDFKVLDLRADLATALAAQGRWDDALAELRQAQADAVRDGRDLKSDARWNVASRLLAFLRRRAAEDPASGMAAGVPAQEAAVEELRAARVAAGKLTAFPAGAHEVP